MDSAILSELGMLTLLKLVTFDDVLLWLVKKK